MNCPLCATDIINSFHNDKGRSYYNCQVCGLVFVPKEYFLSVEDEKARYDQHQNNPEDEGYSSFLMKLGEPMMHLLKSEDRGLDFGAGPTPALAALFKKRGFGMARFDPFYADNQDLLLNTYDFITATEVVEHLHRPKEVFEKLFNMLKPGGLLGLMTKKMPEQKVFASWWYKNDRTHVCFYSDNTWGWIENRWNVNLIYAKGDVFIFRK